MAPDAWRRSLCACLLATCVSLVVAGCSDGDGAVADGAVADGGVADGAVADGGVADGAVADGGVADGGVADGGVADGGVADGGVADGGVADGGVADGGVADGGVLPGFVRIGPGMFTMGSPPGELGRQSDESQHEVRLTRGFMLETTEVTQGQWRALMGNDPARFSSCGDECPVERVSWWEALSYANALSRSEGLAECYTLSGCTGTAGMGMTCSGVTVTAAGGDPYGCEGYRLPTESEWEYAYRAGTTTAFHNGGITALGCGDPTPGAIGWNCGNAGGRTHPVAQKAPNAWGLHDMSGNVWEWCWDWYGPYPGGTVTDPVGPGTGAPRVDRGGGWDSGAEYARAAFRYSVLPGSRYGDLGFRLARSML